MLDKVHTFDLAIGFFNMFLHLVDLSENELSLLNHINSHVLRWNFCWSPPTKESWESFDYDPSRLYKLVEEHGRKPKLLIDKSQTKNVTARKRALLGGPSDRIGANYTPTAKNLLLRCFFNVVWLWRQCLQQWHFQGFAKASSKVWGEAGAGSEADHLLSSSFHWAGEGEAGGRVAGGEQDHLISVMACCRLRARRSVWD